MRQIKLFHDTSASYESNSIWHGHVKMCSYPLSQQALSHWKFVLHFCEHCPCIDIPGQESDRNHSNTFTPIQFHVYHLISHCTVHGRYPLYEKKLLLVFAWSRLCATCKTIHKKRACYYRHIYWWFPHKFLNYRNKNASISSTTRREGFKHSRMFQYMLCHCDYSEIVVASFAHQT